MNAVAQVVAYLLKKSITPSDQQTATLNWIVNERGHLQLRARAGCGKTTTLIWMVQTIIANGGGNGICMAFNRKIADELAAKLKELGIDWKVFEANTVHSFGLRAWKKMYPNVSTNKDKLHDIVQSIATDLMNPDDFFAVHADTLVKLCSLGKQNAIGHLCEIDDLKEWQEIYDHHGLEDDLAQDADTTRVIQAAIKVYKVSLSQCRQVIDFDDMILAPLVFKARFWPKDWILGDEWQDSNKARRALALAMLHPTRGRMCFVGDEAQAIYGFTGAGSDSMGEMTRQLNAKTLALNVTRRCPKSVVKLAQAFVPDFQAHESNAEGIVRTAAYEALKSEELTKHDAILCRNTAPLVATAFRLISQGVACRVEGRDIGKGLVKLARRWKIKTLAALQNKLDTYLAQQTAKYSSKGQEQKIANIADQVECLRVVISRNVLKGSTTIEQLCKDITEMFGDTKDGEQAPVLTLSTVHKAKGREWKRVYILGRRQFMPSPYARKEWQLVQEKNLEYVSITRAISELIDVPYPETVTK